jgi:thymidylate synthase (FAD)
MLENLVLRDPFIRVSALTQTFQPQTVIWQAMHQDYSENFVGIESPPDERKAGDLCIKYLLANKRGHFGPLEHPAITLAIGYFPHSVMQQARTHRVGVSFDVQSMRYTGQRIRKVVSGDVDPWSVFYSRPAGTYMNRQGKKFDWTEENRLEELNEFEWLAKRYVEKLDAGIAEEHARESLPFGFRQHFVVSFSLRAILHFMDLRSKMDAQDEIRALCSLMWPHVIHWAPDIAEWYETNRLGKALLAP